MTPIATERMDHVSLATLDLAASLAFYKDMLGFRIIDRPPLDFDGAWLAKDGFTIHLIVPKEGVERATPASAANPYLSHVAFRVPDVDGTRRALEERGLRFVEQAGRVHQIWTLDPGGNMIEFIRAPS
ncbi:MAG: VOC family protein [Hyphomonadaceae bacterium]|nr:VOC family protein [Hyphomonadaceae bacterium]